MLSNALKIQQRFLKTLEMVNMRFLPPFKMSTTWNGLKQQNNIQHIKYIAEKSKI